MDLYIFFSLALWIGIIFAFKSVSRLLAQKGDGFYYFVLLFAVHPVFVQSVSWIVAQKHLLSFLFILLFIKDVIEKNQSSNSPWNWGKAPLYYALSVLSHPIMVLVPFWSVFYAKEKGYQPRQLLNVIGIVIIFIMILTLGINFYYYSQMYPQLFSANKLGGGTFALGDRVLALSRYFIQIFIPVNFSPIYSKGSLWNLVGIPVVVVMSFIAFKVLKGSNNRSLVLLFVLPLCVVITKMTNIFISDTYILLSTASTFLIFIATYKGELAKKHRYIKLVISILILMGVARSNIEASYFTNYSRYVENAYQKQKSCPNLQYYTQDLFKQAKTNQAVEMGELMIRRKCVWKNKANIGELRILLAKIITFSKKGNIPNKKIQLLKMSSQGLYFKFAYGGFLVKHKMFDEGMKELNEALADSLHVKIDQDDLFIKIFKDYCSLGNLRLDHQQVCERLDAKLLLGN
jgi:hypothetical protein